MIKEFKEYGVDIAREDGFYIGQLVDRNKSKNNKEKILVLPVTVADEILKQPVPILSIDTKYILTISNEEYKRNESDWESYKRKLVEERKEKLKNG